MRDGHREYMPSLDGLRALSIVLVVLGHALYFTAPAALRPASAVFDGTLGVRIFFVISGFLITTLLLKEQDAGAISLKRFYIRRTLRLAPVQLAYIALLFLLTQLTRLEVSACQFATALTYTKNYGCSAWIDAHLWSLSVEEQFYLLWPAVLVFLPRRGAFLAMAGLIVLAPLSRGFEYHLGHRIFTWLSSNADILMIGFAAALAYHAGVLRRLMSFRPTAMRLAALALFATPPLLSAHLMLAALTVTVGPTLEAMAAAYLICSYIMVRRGAGYRLLNLPAVSFLGRMSYSLYVWQQLFFENPSGYGLSSALPLQFPFNVGFALLAGVASYRLIELPMTRLRARFRTPATALDPPSVQAIEQTG